MKQLFLVLAVLSGMAFAQGVRFEGPPIRSTATIAGQTPTFETVTNASNVTFAICDKPANAVPCTNKTATYTDDTLNTSCDTSVQLVLAGADGNCVAHGDSTGHWGFYGAPGQYEYTYTLSTGQSFGPYPITLGGSGGSSTGFDSTKNTQVPFVDSTASANIGYDTHLFYTKGSHTLTMDNLSLGGTGGMSMVGGGGTCTADGNPSHGAWCFDSTLHFFLSYAGAAYKEVLRKTEVDGATDIKLGATTTPVATTGAANAIPSAGSDGKISYTFVPAGVHPFAADHTTDSTDCGYLIKMNVAGTLYLGTSLANCRFSVMNVNASALTISRAAPGCLCFINGVTTSISLNQGERVDMNSDGTDYFSSVPVRGSTGIGVNLSGQKLAITYSGSQVQGWCQGAVNTGTNIHEVLVGFKSSNNILCDDANVVEMPVSADYTASNLYCISSANGAHADSGVCELWVMGSPSALTCTIGTGTTCSDTTHSVTITAGQHYSLRLTTGPTGSDAVANLRMSVNLK